MRLSVICLQTNLALCEQRLKDYNDHGARPALKTIVQIAGHVFHPSQSIELLRISGLEADPPRDHTPVDIHSPRTVGPYIRYLDAFTLQCSERTKGGSGEGGGGGGGLQ